MFFDLLTGNIVKTTDNPSIHLADGLLHFWGKGYGFNILFTKKFKTELKTIYNKIEQQFRVNLLESFSYNKIYVELQGPMENMNLILHKSDVTITITMNLLHFPKFIIFLFGEELRQKTLQQE